MPRALSHFADPKFLTLVLLDVFKLWCQRWMQFERNHGGNWTEDEVCQVEEVLIAQVNKLYGTMGRGATVADAIKLPKQAFLDLGPNLERPIELLQKVLLEDGCWLKGELPSCEFHGVFGAWHQERRRLKDRFVGLCIGSAMWAVHFRMQDELDHDPTVAEVGEISLEYALATHGIGPRLAEAISAFRVDCGYKPLK